ncbi:MAG: phosphonate C-P lyase system protein PhnL [Devosia sp.]
MTAARHTQLAKGRVLTVTGLAKTFTIHLKGGVQLPAVEGASFHVDAGECVVLGGPSGAGKSSILKMVSGTYGVSAGSILLEHGGETLNVATLSPRQMMAVRRDALASVTQFLRAIPRVPAIELVAGSADPDLAPDAAREKAAAMLCQLNLPERLWGLPPATFSGGEKQRVNIAAGLIREVTLLLVDEPTASLDAENRQVVVELLARKKATGTAILGIFHDEDVRRAVADRVIDVRAFAPGSTPKEDV